MTILEPIEHLLQPEPSSVEPVVRVEQVELPEIEAVSSSEPASVGLSEGVIVTISDQGREALLRERIEADLERLLDAQQYSSYLDKLHQEQLILAVQKYGQHVPLTLPLERRPDMEKYMLAQQRVVGLGETPPSRNTPEYREHYGLYTA